MLLNQALQTIKSAYAKDPVSGGLVCGLFILLGMMLWPIILFILMIEGFGVAGTSIWASLSRPVRTQSTGPCNCAECQAKRRPPVDIDAPLPDCFGPLVFVETRLARKIGGELLCVNQPVYVPDRQGHGFYGFLDDLLNLRVGVCRFRRGRWNVRFGWVLWFLHS